MSASETNWGVQGSQPHTPAEVDEHAIIDGVHAKKTFPIALPPTAQTNPSLVLTYDGSNQLTGIAMTISGTTYNRTLTWVGGVCTAVSVWSTA